jgi:UDP-N-acetylglucosamine--N-acetylmuramyl-(pentapeptide) pyrophosphoryl-undecaprenol N-acetylglucosamine transferase
LFKPHASLHFTRGPRRRIMENNNIKTVCFVAGKSGGHIIPCLTIARNNYTQHASTNILFFSANTPLDHRILSADKNISWHIPLSLSSRAGSRLKTIWHAFYSFMHSFFYLLKHRPETIISTGGIVAIPACLAGFILRIPITLYSLDAVPGKAIQFLAPLATSIITPFASSQKHFPAQKCSVEQYPIKYPAAADTGDQRTALQKLGLSLNKKTIVVLGGSQGSMFLNDCMKRLVNDPSFNAETTQIIHQTGSSDGTNWNSLYEKKNVTAYVFSYMPDLKQVYLAADLIICRAGAGTLFEIKFFNKPCIIIPLETNTTTHQVDNAHAMTAEYPELFCMLAQANIEKEFGILAQKINGIEDFK